MHNRTARNSENSIQKLKEMILDHQYQASLAEDEPFVFNLKYDEHNELILGDGTAKKPVRILFSSKSMIKHLRQKGGVAHLDCTYKIMTTNYNLLIFGVTDIQGKFHPVAFMIINKEREEDFIHFYSALKNFCKEEFDFDYEPRFIMQDHNQASYNAAKQIFPRAKI